MKTKKKKSKQVVETFVSFQDNPWETTNYMIEQQRNRDNSPYFNYAYNRTTGKVERIK